MKKNYLCLLISMIVLLTAFMTGCGEKKTSGGIFSRDTRKQCISCEGSGDCQPCKGSGDCLFCETTREKVCVICWGTDLCQHCGADGKRENDRQCISCKGNGKCYSCIGGYTECYNCSKTGKCSECDGSGKCITCGGEGKYDDTVYYDFYVKEEHSDCNASGTISCEVCTDGTCTECDGSGHSDCGICQGTGKCNLCNGNPSSRYNGKCRICSSTGKCKYCNNGKKDCNSCYGLKKCVECFGKHTRKCGNCVEGYYYRRVSVEPTGENIKGNIVSPSDPAPEPTPAPPNPGQKKMCSNCGGKGTIDCTKCIGGRCERCNGSGFAIDSYLGNTAKRKCVSCNGKMSCSYCDGRGEMNCTYCN